MNQGKVYWITGLAGAGKTTVGTALYYKLRETEPKTVILDGDLLKSIVGDGEGYSYEERLIRAKRYSDLCKLLSDQGFTVVMCTIAMYDQVRRWNRENIAGYLEIFLEVSDEVLRERDSRGVYSDYHQGKRKNIVGLDTVMELPKNPDIVIHNDNENSVKSSVERILKLEPKVKNDYNRDTEYWNAYYAGNQQFLEPSKFACDMLPYMKVGKQLLDIGCGNGRDSLFFLQKGLRVTGLDASQTAIEGLKRKCMNQDAIFICDDFVRSATVYQKEFDYYYSRFTLHAITDRQETELLSNIFNTMKKGSLLFIESRSVNDDLYGKGERVGRHSYIYDQHFRRFIVISELIEKLERIGYTILMAKESRGYAPTRDSDPMLIRIVVKRK